MAHREGGGGGKKSGNFNGDWRGAGVFDQMKKIN